MLCAACIRETVIEHDPVKCVNRLNCVNAPVAAEWRRRPFPDDVVEVFGLTIIESHQWANNVAMDVGTVISKASANNITRAITGIDRIVVEPVIDTFTESVANVLKDCPPFVLG